MVKLSVLLIWLLRMFLIVFLLIFIWLVSSAMMQMLRMPFPSCLFTEAKILSLRLMLIMKKMIDMLLSIIPFDSIKKWFSENPDIAFLVLCHCLLISYFVGGAIFA